MRERRRGARAGRRVGGMLETSASRCCGARVLPRATAELRRLVFRVCTSPAFHVGAWLSLVERSVRDREVVGSNPIAPTTSSSQLSAVGFQRKRLSALGFRLTAVRNRIQLAASHWL